MLGTLELDEIMSNQIIFSISIVPRRTLKSAIGRFFATFGAVEIELKKNEFDVTTVVVVDYITYTFPYLHDGYLPTI